MFRVTFFCDDKKLGDILRGLAGLALGTPEVVPVVNAGVGKNGLQAQTGGKIYEMFAAWIHKHKLHEVRSRDAKAFLKETGSGAQSSSYHLKKLVEVGVLRKAGKGSGMYYKVAPTKAASK
jgi:hypothetical protein